MARIVERLYAKQNGVFGLDAGIPTDDTMSRALFFRNQGPLCKAPKTESEPACYALPRRSPSVSGLSDSRAQGALRARTARLHDPA